MQHLEEGTIHAWIDGELSAAESTTLEDHLASCAACREAVAVARGHVAAASRIVSALDEVPVGVVPKATESGVVHITRPRQAKAPRRWASNVKFAAAAALLVAAIGTWRVVQRTPAPVSEAAQMESDQAPLPAVAPPNAERAADVVATPIAPQANNASPTPAKPAAPSTRPLAADAAELQKKAPVQSAPATTPSGGGAAAALRESAVSSARPKLLRRDSSLKLEGVVATGASESIERKSSEDKRSEVAADSSKRDRNERARDREAPRQQVVVLPDAATSQEKRRVADEVKAQAGASPPPVPAPVQGAGARAAQSGLASGKTMSVGPTPVRCYDVARSTEAERAGVPLTVQLMDIVGDTVAGRVVRIVMSPAGAGWFWSTAPDGSVILSRMRNDSVVYETRLTGVAAKDAVGTPRVCVNR